MSLVRLWAPEGQGRVWCISVSPCHLSQLLAQRRCSVNTRRSEWMNTSIRQFHGSPHQQQWAQCVYKNGLSVKWSLQEMAHRSVCGRVPIGKAETGLGVWRGYWTGNLEAWVSTPANSTTQLGDLRSSCLPLWALRHTSVEWELGVLSKDLSFWHKVCRLPWQSLKALGTQRLNQKSIWKLLGDYELSICLKAAQFQ